MNKVQLISVITAVVVAVGLYFIPIKPGKSVEAERSRSLEMEAFSERGVIEGALEKTEGADKTTINILMDQLSLATTDSAKVSVLKELSGTWYRMGQPLAAGVYAQRIADSENTDESWAMAGTTYILAMKKQEDEKEKQFAKGRAISSLENAISLNPNEVSHRINLAMCHVELPAQDDPMKGILMLRELSEKYPENAAVYVRLASLAIRTGQYDKALERLRQALELEPDDAEALLLTAQAYEAKGDKENARVYFEKFEQARNQ